MYGKHRWIHLQVLYAVLYAVLLIVQSEVYKFTSPGTTEQVQCHCKNNEPCEQQTGHCPSGCDDSVPWSPWGGPGCQIGNIAIGKTLKPYQDHGYGIPGGMNYTKGIDGNRSRTYSDYEWTGAWCNTTRCRAGLYVYLDDRFVVINVTVTTLSDEAHRETLDTLDIYWWQQDHNARCEIELMGQNASIVALCRNVKTSYIYIATHRHKREKNHVYFSEVEVIGYEYKDCNTPDSNGGYYYGPGCLLKCQCSGPCVTTTGKCHYIPEVPYDFDPWLSPTNEPQATEWPWCWAVTGVSLAVALVVVVIHVVLKKSDQPCCLTGFSDVAISRYRQFRNSQEHLADLQMCYENRPEALQHVTNEPAADDVCGSNSSSNSSSQQPLCE